MPNLNLKLLEKVLRGEKLADKELDLYESNGLLMGANPNTQIHNLKNARAQGAARDLYMDEFDVPAYHVSKGSANRHTALSEFKPDDTKSRWGDGDIPRSTFFARNPQTSNTYTYNPVSSPYGSYSTMYPARIRSEGFGQMQWADEDGGHLFWNNGPTSPIIKTPEGERALGGTEAWELNPDTNTVAQYSMREGMPGLAIDDMLDRGPYRHALTEELPLTDNVVVVNDPSRIRSKFAAFDPLRRKSKDILAGLAVTGGAIREGMGDRWDEVPMMDREEYSSSDDKILDTLANTKALTKNMARIPVNVLSAVLNAPGVINPGGDPGWDLDTATAKLGIPELNNLPDIGAAGALLWQGSPHRGVTRLSDKAIGTGEGSQAFTRGHYMAQNPKVALGYVGDQDSRWHLKPQDVRVGGMELTDSRIWDHPALSAETREWVKDPNNLQQLLGDVMIDNEGSLAGVSDNLQSYIDVARRATSGEYGWKPEVVKSSLRNAELIEHLQKFPMTLSGVKRTPTLYNWEIPDKAIPDMVQWDKLISEQPANVTRALRNMPDYLLNSEYRSRSNPGQTVGDIIADYPDVYSAGKVLHALEGAYSDDAKLVARVLRDNGVPGNKFLDGLSRRKGTGEHNYVIYDPDLAKLKGSISVESSPATLNRSYR